MQYVVDQAKPHLGGNIFGGDARSFYPMLWRWLQARFQIDSVFDVGCAEGLALWAFTGLGMRSIGLDGLQYNVAEASRHAPVIYADLTQFACPLPGIDLVWCCEVAEHVAPDHVDKLISTIACGRVLAMTHAVPGQEGWHHVNCQPASYWIDQLGRHGMSLDEESTAISRELAGDYWKATGMIFTRSQ